MKKQIFAYTLILLCALLCACETTTPVETSTASVTTTLAPAKTTAVTTTAPIETTAAVTTTAPILSTEPLIVEKRADIHHNLSWMNSLENNVSYDYDYPQAVFSLALPLGWEEAGAAYGSVDNKHSIRLADIYESSQTELQNLPSMRVLYGKLIETIEKDGLLIYVYKNQGLDEDQYPYFMQGYSRIQNTYYFNFYFYTDTADTTQIKSILQTAAFVELPQTTPQEDVKVQIHEPLTTVRINALRHVSHSSFYESETEALPNGSYLAIGIPASWNPLPTKDGASGVYNVIYTEFGIPDVGLSPNRCMYQAFCGNYLYIADAISLRGTEGITTDGKKYWLTSTEKEDYHAIEYHATVQVSDAYYYDFILCVDKDNSDLIYRVLDSIHLY